jgi:hypothetical protein
MKKVTTTDIIECFLLIFQSWEKVKEKGKHFVSIIIIQKMNESVARWYMRERITSNETDWKAKASFSSFWTNLSFPSKNRLQFSHRHNIMLFRWLNSVVYAYVVMRFMKETWQKLILKILTFTQDTMRRLLD